MRPTPGRPTLERSPRAGVGRGTASRVINGGAKVSARSRGAVEDAIAELGYVPNPAARALVRKRTDTVALVIAESEERVFGEPFFAGVVRGIGAALADADRQLVLIRAQASQRRGSLDHYLTRQHVGGVLLLSLRDDDEPPDRIRAHELPLVAGRSGLQGYAARWPPRAGPSTSGSSSTATSVRRAVRRRCRRCSGASPRSTPCAAPTT